MFLNEQQLDAVEQYAGLFYTAKEIAVILELPPAELIAAIKDEQSEIYKRFYKGRLIKEAAIRKSVLQLAVQGSSPAQMMAMKIFDTSKVKLH
ncbi:MAG TPA: hypothetical protein PL045_08260, partial [Chitinophagaceae bacterium]|nr:hypothetical protein [Chitinophagaceae bacterium]